MTTATLPFAADRRGQCLAFLLPGGDVVGPDVALHLAVGHRPVPGDHRDPGLRAPAI